MNPETVQDFLNYRNEIQTWSQEALLHEFNRLKNRENHKLTYMEARMIHELRLAIPAVVRGEARTVGHNPSNGPRIPRSRRLGPKKEITLL